MSDIFTPEKRSQIMSAIKSKNSKAEILLRKALFNLGFRYRLHNPKIFGKPDISIKKYNMVIFIDGDWWHGRNYKKEFKKYSEFWQNKIMNNVIRDKLVNTNLENEGWTVLRYWQKDIENNFSAIAREIKVKISDLKIK